MSDELLVREGVYRGLQIRYVVSRASGNFVATVEGECVGAWRTLDHAVNEAMAYIDGIASGAKIPATLIDRNAEGWIGEDVVLTGIHAKSGRVLYRRPAERVQELSALRTHYLLRRLTGPEKLRLSEMSAQQQDITQRIKAFIEERRLDPVSAFKDEAEHRAGGKPEETCPPNDP